MSNLPLIFTKINAGFLTTEQVENDLASSQTRIETTKKTAHKFQEISPPENLCAVFGLGWTNVCFKIVGSSQPMSSC